MNYRLNLWFDRLDPAWRFAVFFAVLSTIVTVPVGAFLAFDVTDRTYFVLQVCCYGLLTLLALLRLFYLRQRAG